MDPLNVVEHETEIPNHYKYNPIDPTGEIRILILQPPSSPDEAELHCEITTAKFSDNLSYEAISYCWGADVFPETLYLPNGTLAVTENLASGLRRFRLHDQPRRLWADAVCINQRDDKEKGHQVALMAEIYRNAECVLVWLGESNETIDAGIELIRELAHEAWRYGLKYDDFLMWRLQNLQLKIHDHENGITVALFRLSTEKDFTSITAFTKQNWFTRLWVIQEFALAPKVQIINGYNILSHEELFLAMAALFLLSRLSDAVSEIVNKRGFVEAWSTVLQRPVHRDLKTDRLLHLLFEHSGRQCKLDQDRIYGLLALASTGSGTDLDIDYKLSVEEVYTQLAIAHFKENDLEILHYVHSPKRDRDYSQSTSAKEEDRLALPSWVPDWRPPSFASLFHAPTELQAGTKLAPYIAFNTSSPNNLGMEGVRIDIIEDHSPTRLDKSPDGKDLDVWYLQVVAGLRALKAMFDQKIARRPYPTGEDPRIAFARCLLLDNKLVGTQKHLGPDLNT
ncbi:HET-domain-containing protein [Hyaloscypha variabilis F]|uniref:HET-domain-containing protein n=1 Tax=Hyaloscypha variabilis (strain UAMH 11265 / GT02V1 / F) TaxID=1149755 RepID=A0A2J6S7Y0_HYAVF|nr:HET-domain-containing protein [Hyaloscypha variabilis F]